MSDDTRPPRKPVATFMMAGAYGLAYVVAPVLVHPTCERLLTTCAGNVPVHHRHHPETPEGSTVVGSTTNMPAVTFTNTAVPPAPSLSGSQLGLMGLAGPVHGTLPRRTTS